MIESAVESMDAEAYTMHLKLDFHHFLILTDFFPHLYSRDESVLAEDHFHAKNEGKLAKGTTQFLTFSKSPYRLIVVVLFIRARSRYDQGTCHVKCI